MAQPPFIALELFSHAVAPEYEIDLDNRKRSLPERFEVSQSSSTQAGGSVMITIDKNCFRMRVDFHNFRAALARRPVIRLAENIRMRIRRDVFRLKPLSRGARVERGFPCSRRRDFGTVGAGSDILIPRQIRGRIGLSEPERAHEW